jgi:hypothetical protein
MLRTLKLAKGQAIRNMATGTEMALDANAYVVGEVKGRPGMEYKFYPKGLILEREIGTSPWQTEESKGLSDLNAHMNTHIFGLLFKR